MKSALRPQSLLDKTLLSHPLRVLFFCWLVLTAININKAYHIDDTFHVEAAQRILEEPLKPMSGLINWNWTPEPLHHSNQPALFFYMLAAVIRFFGTSEPVLHLFLSLFTFLALYFFLKMAELLQLQNTGVLLIFFAFCPAFIVNQDVMTDVPILALSLGFTYFVLKARYRKALANYCAAVAMLSMGLLIKYSLLPLLAVLLVIIFIRRHYAYLPIALLPVLVLFFWSLWNYYEYGDIHILTRPKTEMQMTRQLLAFLGCLGAVSAFGFAFAYGLYPSKIIAWLLGLVVVVFVVSVARFAAGHISEHEYAADLCKAFFVNGTIVCVALLFSIVAAVIKMGFLNFLYSDRFVLFALFGTISVFFILFAPFMATRHVLLLIPFILLLGHSLVDKASPFIKGLSLSLAVVMGILIGLSDWMYADYYRQLARRSDLPKDGTLWSVGHWGWQWYSMQAGMPQYHTGQSPVKDGDYILYPATIARQEIQHNAQLSLISKKWKEPGPLTFFSVSDVAAMYNSFVDKAPWSLSKRPVDTLYIFKIKMIPDTANH